MKHVTFIGYGEIGSALGSLMKPQAQIRTWDKNPEKVSPSIHSPQEAVTGADVIFLCVPSWTIRDVVEQIAPHISDQTVVVSLAKGLEMQTLKTMDIVLKETVPAVQASGVLGGPLLAEELEAGLPGIGVVGAKDVRVFDRLKPLFTGTMLRLEYSNDSTGVALASVLKNIYAVVLGIAEGFGWGWNAKGWLAAKGFQEMCLIAEVLHVDLAVMRGSAGAGDFLATALSPDSFNRETGRKIAQTGECRTPSEGCRSVESVLTLLGAKKLQLPILFSLDQILNQHADPKTVIYHLLASP